MFRPAHLTVALIALLSYPAFPSAFGVDPMVFQCRSNDSSGNPVECDNPIPAAGSIGPMDPSIITVPEGVFPCAINDLDISIELTHAWRADLDVTLTHVPTGISVELWTDVGSSGDDFDVLLDDEAGTDITAGPCGNSGSVCVGTFQPEAPAMLSDFDGIDPAGDWQLDINDDSGGDTGALVGWSIIIFMTADSDSDGVPDCFDACPGVADDTDADSDGVPDCNDNCPADPNKLDPGECGCGNPDTDNDADGVADCNDNCPNDPNKLDPGDCGCGNPDTDTTGNGIPDCIDPPPPPPPPPAETPAPDPCAPAGMMMMPMTLLGIGFMRRRRSNTRRKPSRRSNR